MRCAEGVVFALAPLDEAIQTVFLAQSPNSVTPASQNFMRVGLVPDIPDETILGRVKNIVKCRRQFDHAKARAQMPTSHRNRVNSLSP